MYTPETTRERKILRNEINHKFVDVNPINIFKNLQSKLHPVITFSTLQPFCLSADIPLESLPAIFAPYGVNEPYISQQQFIKFFNDDFPDYTKTGYAPGPLNEQQKFILQKFMYILRNKFGSTMNSRWTAALTRNPPNSLNTDLRVSALCRLYSEMNLPFTASEFVDSLFAFYQEKVTSISFDQFTQLFTTFQ